MAKCWTCGTGVDTATYTCGVCENSSTLAILRRDAGERAGSRGDVMTAERVETAELTDLAENARPVDASTALERIQDEGAQELREAMASLSRVSSVMPEWRVVMTRMLESRGVIGLASAIRWGFGELSWQAHQASDVLSSIDRSLRTPSATQADEWREMAEELRRRGVLRESEEFYLKALELNRLDYRIYVGLAETLIRGSRFEDATRMLERSLPHAPADDIDYRSHSLRLLGHIRECEGDYERARHALERAVELSPAYVEARYDLAQYAAQSGEAEAAVASLREVLLARPTYWYLANVEPNFDPVRADVDDLLDDLKSTARGACAEALRRAELAVREAGNAVDQADGLRALTRVEQELASEDRYAVAVVTMERARAEAGSEDYLTVLGARETTEEVISHALCARDEARAEAEDLRARVAGMGTFGATLVAGTPSSGPSRSSSPAQAAGATATVPLEEPESLADEARRLLRLVLGGAKSAAVLAPIAAFVLAVAGFMHGSMVMNIDNLDAPFVYLWGYVSRGAPLAAAAAFVVGLWRTRGREADERVEALGAEA